MSKKKTKPTITHDAELRLADDAEIEVLTLPVDEATVSVVQDSELAEELREDVTSVSPKGGQKKINLFQNDVLVDRIEKDVDGGLGRSFRSKELSEEDLLEREIMPTLEDNWVRESNAQSNVSWVSRFIFLGIILVMVAGVWAFISLDKEDVTKEQRDKELKKLVLSVKEEEEARVRDGVNQNECIRGYLEATTVKERAKWCRDPEETLLKMTNYYKDKLIFDSFRFERIKTSSEFILHLEKVLIVSVDVSDNSGGFTTKMSHKELLLTKQEDGTYLVDWDTAVTYQPSDWDSFVESRSTKPHVFRVEVRERINYGPYLYSFSDDNEYQAYRLSIRDNDGKYLIGYTKKDSPVDLKMKSLALESNGGNRSKEKMAPVVIKLVYPKDSESDQCVEIIEIVSDSWFIP